jgi:hypothetical protein
MINSIKARNPKAYIGVINTQAPCILSEMIADKGMVYPAKYFQARASDIAQNYQKDCAIPYVTFITE